MRIALIALSPSDGNESLELFALRARLKDHDIVEWAGGDDPARLASCDLLLLSGSGLLDGKGTVVREIEAKGLTGLSAPLVPLGLKAPLPLHDDETRFLRERCEEIGSLSVADPLTEERLGASLGETRLKLTGCPLPPRAASRPAAPIAAKGVFCPSAAAPTISRSLESRFRQNWSDDELLTIALQASDLQGTEPGLFTLHCPRYPEVLWEALASASALLSLRLYPALVGCRKGIPTFVGGLDPAEAALANWLGIPTLEETGEYPHAVIGERMKAIEERMSEYLADLGIERSARAKVEASPPLAVCCIADETYLPYLTGLVENLLAVHAGALRLHVLALDEATDRYLQTRYAFARVYHLADLWDGGEADRMRSRPIADRAYSSKSRLLSRALENEEEAVLYCDLDVYFFRSPVALREELNEASVLLFPHWNDRLKYVKLYGVFNAGMMLVRRGAEPFLGWWSRMCLDHYNRDKQAGYWVDQGALDLAPVLFDTIRVYRRGDENVAFWNLETLAEAVAAKRIGSFHAAGPDRLGLFEVKYCWDQVATFYSPLKNAHGNPELVMNLLAQQKPYWREAWRTYYLHYFLHKLFPGPPRLVSRRLRRYFARGPGRHALDVCLWLYRHYRFLVDKWTQGDRLETGWVALQRGALHSAVSTDKS